MDGIIRYTPYLSLEPLTNSAFTPLIPERAPQVSGHATLYTVATAYSAIDSYNKWNMSSILSFRTPNCIHQILPASIAPSAMNNEAYAEFLTRILPIFRDMRLTVHNTIVDEVERKVVLHASSKAVTDVGEYGNEYMFSFWMTEDGKMVEDLEEIADSKCSVDFMTNLGALAATKGKD